MINFITLCAVALVTVFAILTILALLIRFLVVAFPQKRAEDSDDPALYAAVAAALKSAYPNMAITKIEEIK